MSVLVRTEGVGKTYRSFVALADVSLEIRAGEFVSIVGPNGAGKTTLVNLLTGLLVPTAGRVLFKGRDIAGVGPMRLAAIGMARAFQLVHIFSQLTVAETLAVGVISQQRKHWNFFGGAANDRATNERVAAVAQVFGLENRLAMESRLLSQGEKKLLDVASAFALAPEVILLDEPTSGVSSADKHGIMKVLVEAARQTGVKAIILVEHDMDLVEAYSTRIVALKEGRVLADLPPAEFFADPDIAAAVVGKRVRHA